ncbi:MAG TPA: cyclic nucleotide-binding domain-containing protein [Thermoanaerobaculia bacterium]|nr:cyclic nucleotide-binding domain-containing protein [Thermoanaerobaculia bacterium]
MKAVFKTTSGKEAVKDPTVTIPAGEYIFREGDLGTEMFIIQEGEVHILKKLGAETRVLTRLEKGDFFGEMAVLENVPRTADAYAVRDAKLIAINGSRFDEMIRRNPEISVRIMRKYSRRLREANAMLQELAGDSRIDLEHSAFQPVPSAPGEATSRNRLVDVATGTAFFFGRGTEESTIGRSDPVTGILPEIDLTLVDAHRSVSRRHAKLVRHEDGWAIYEDVGTVNGTFVNEERIPTGVPVPIHDGDRVRIGLIQMKVIFE